MKSNSKKIVPITSTVNGFGGSDDLRDLESAKEYIYSIDFTNIINKLITRHKWLRIEAEETCRQYRNYLYLLKLYDSDKPLPPSEDIDEFWHHAILETKAYIQHTNAIWGCYLHHYPYYDRDGKISLDDLNNAFAETKRLYEKEFGVPLVPTRYRFRPIVRLFLK